jgi:hypothetical protein
VKGIVLFASIAVAAVGCVATPTPAQLNLSGPYKIEIDVYVRNERVLCTQAMNIATERFGASMAALMTMTDSVYDAKKCLAVIYQTAELGDQVVSYGIYVRSKP